MTHQLINGLKITITSNYSSTSQIFNFEVFFFYSATETRAQRDAIFNPIINIHPLQRIPTDYERVTYIWVWFFPRYRRRPFLFSRLVLLVQLACAARRRVNALLIIVLLQYHMLPVNMVIRAC